MKRIYAACAILLISLFFGGFAFAADSVEGYSTVDDSGLSDEYPATSPLIKYVYNQNASNATGEPEPSRDLLDRPTVGHPTEPSAEEYENANSPAANNIENADSSAANNIENAATVDSFMGSIAVFGISAFVVLLFALMMFRKRSKCGRYFVFIFGLVYLAGAFALSFSNATNASADRYVASAESKSLYDTIMSNSDNYASYSSGDGTILVNSNSSNGIVLFGGFCWRVVRTTDAGNVKLAYYGEQTAFGDCLNFNGESDERDPDSLYIGSTGIIDNNFKYVYGGDNFDEISSRKEYWPFENIEHSPCYKMLLGYNIDTSMAEVANGVARCKMDTSQQYYGENVEYVDGHYYIVGDISADYDYEPVIPVCHAHYFNGNPQCYQRPGVDGRYYINGSGTQVNATEQKEGILASKTVNKYFCRESAGAVKLDENRVDCGNSINYHYGHGFGLGSLVMIVKGSPEAYEERVIDSSTKEALEAWYEENLLPYSSNIADDIFCVGKPVDYSVSYGLPRFEGSDASSMSGCVGGDSLTVSGKNGSLALLNYPIMLMDEEEAGYYGDYGSLPVINLASSALVVSGDGSPYLPYIIAGESKPDIASDVKTIKADNAAMYEVLVSYFTDRHAGYYQLSSDPDTLSITLDVNKPIPFIDLSYLQISDASVLEELPFIYSLDISGNELVSIPDMNFYKDGEYRFGYNHIPSLSRLDAYFEHRLADYGRSAIRGLLEEYRQTVTVEYADPENIKNPPILRQFLDFATNRSSGFYSVSHVGVKNLEYKDSLDYSRALDTNEYSYTTVVKDEK